MPTTRKGKPYGGGRFSGNVGAKRYLPRYKLYKAPQQRLKTFPSVSTAYAAQCFFYSLSQLNATNYLTPGGSRSLIEYGRGCPVHISTVSANIPRYNPVASTNVSEGRRNSPFNSRLNDRITIHSMAISRRIFNYTTTPFLVRTFVFHNTGRVSPGNGVALSNDSQDYGRIGSDGAAGANQLKTNVPNLTDRIDGVDQPAVPCTGEELRRVRFDYDLVEKRSDLIADMATVIEPQLISSFPMREDGYVDDRRLGNGPNLLSSSNGAANPLARVQDVKKIWVPMRKNVRFEDDGINENIVEGDFYVVTMFAPTREPAISAVQGTPGTPLTADVYCAGEIDFEIETTLSFTDGS
jgi:hypothetical protein